MPSSVVYTAKVSDKFVFPSCADQHSTQGQYKGTTPSRQVTDVFFLVGILLLWSAMSIIGALAVQNGNPLRLIAPISDDGSLCGQSSGKVDAPVWYQVSTWGQGVCLPSCPVAKSPAPVYSLTHTDYVCLSWVEQLFGFTNTDANSAVNANFQTYLKTACMSNGVFSPWGRYDPDLGACGCNLIYPSTNVVNRCFFNDAAQRTQFNQGMPDYFVAFMSDIVTARYLIFAFGFLLALFLSFLYSHVLRFEYLGLVLVWGSIAVTFCAMSSLVGVCWWRAAQWAGESPQVHSTTARLALQAFSILMLCFVALYLCACIFLRRSVNLAIKVVALAATAVESMILLVFTPLFHLVGLACFVAPMLTYGFFIASSGRLTQLYTTCYPATSASGVVISGPACVPASNGLTAAQRAAAVRIPTGLMYQLDDPYAAGEQLWFLFFCLLWTMNFIAGLGSLVIATAVATWYFTPFEDRPTVDSRTVVQAYGIVLKYHIGTAACGGLVIGIVQFFRWVALYVEKHCKTVQSNLVARTVFCCVDCCLCFLEKCLKFVSKQRYIQTAIHGSTFCTGCKDAFFTVARNIFSIGAVSVVSGIALTIGKVFVTAIAGISSYLFFQGYYKTEMYDDIACTVLVMILAWISSSVFSEVFHMAADTVLMCYITDSEQNDGVPQHAAQDMCEFLAEYGALTSDHKRVRESGPGAAAGDKQSPPTLPHTV